jgi:hypothetical protein
VGVALDLIKQIKVVEYDWLDGTHDIGIIAEELAKIIPEAVWHKDGKIEGIKPLTMVGILVKAVQELSKEMEK